MGDPAYSEFFVNTGFVVKQEPMVVEQSGGVPIPSRKTTNDVIQGFKYDLGKYKKINLFSFAKKIVKNTNLDLCSEFCFY